MARARQREPGIPTVRLHRLRPNRARLSERLLGGYLRKWVILGLLIGVVAGLGAILFFEAIDWSTGVFLGGLAGFDPPVPRGEGVLAFDPPSHAWRLPLIVGLGGLLSGLLVFTLAPEAEGHGTDAAIEAFHERGGRIRSRIPVIKLVASALTIGSGGSAGREGPTAQIAAGFGSWLGDVFQLTAEDRRVAVAVGVGAGIGAIFKAPLGGALLAGEILYVRDFELSALVPGFIASVVGYTIFAGWAGWDPVFGGALGFQFRDPASLGWYALLGLIAGGVGFGYVRVFYGMRDAFLRLRMPPHFKPALAGVLVGVIAIWFPEVLAMGYGWLQFAIEGRSAELALGTILALVVLKILATALTIGSGGSGGVFAPGLFIGGMVGAGMWGLLDGHVPALPADPEPFVVVGMGALFGGIAKAPIAVMLMVAEMTGEFSMIVPAMIATSIAYLVTGNTTIYENQVPTRADSPAHRGEYSVPLLRVIRASDAMTRDVTSVQADDGLVDALQRMAAAGVAAAPVLDDGRLVGVLSQSDILRARLEGRERAAEAITRAPVVAYPGEALFAVVQRMAGNAATSLPIVDRHDPTILLGVVSMGDIGRTLDRYARRLVDRPEAVRSGPDDPLRAITVGEAMSTSFEALPETCPITEAARILAARAVHAALVVNEEGGLTGLVTEADLARGAEAHPDGVVSTVATRPVITATPDQLVADAIHRPGAERYRQIPVVADRGAGGRPIGLLRRQDIVATYLGTPTVRDSSRDAASDHNERPTTLDFLIERHDRANGRTVAELDLPRGALVVSIERGGQVYVPHGAFRLLTGDRVRLLASQRVRQAAARSFSGRSGPSSPATPGADKREPSI